jgi:hypothetical protein
MMKFIAGLFLGLVLATFAPNIAGVSRDLFEAVGNLGGEVIETAEEAASE